ncbi:MAG: O-antigen ligase family protein [Candidatus Velamenicoccus archaeovorus]
MRAWVYRLSLVLVFTIPWEGLIDVAGIGTIAKLIGLVVAGLWLFVVVMTGGLRKPPPFLAALGLLVGWIALSVFWSADPVRSFRFVGTWVQCMGLALILWDLYRTRERVLAGLQAYILGAYVAVGGAIINFFAGNAFYTHYDRFSPGETNPDGFGFIIALGVPVAWYLASTPTTRTTSRFLRFTKIVNHGYIPLAFFGIALSGTRTAMVAALAGMAFGLVALRRIRPTVRLPMLLAVAVAIYLLIPIVQPLRSFQRLGTTATEATQGDLNGRIPQWTEGVRAFTVHPLIGYGANMYSTVNDIPRQSERAGKTNGLGKAAHNTFVAILVELGLVGFVLFWIILGIVTGRALKLPRWERAFWLTVLLVWTIGSSTLTWGHRKTTWLFFTLLLAASMVWRRDEPPVVEDEVVPAAPSRVGAPA